jgi:electron transport complex protein RnfB
MHTVIEAACTGCDLCLPVCPVDCIEMVPVSNERTGWSAWSAELAQQARKRYEARQLRVLAEPVEEDTKKIGKQAIIEAALTKAKARLKS